MPSEKIYQFSFYQLLSNICPRDSPILPILDMNREKGKVDLALLTPKGNYQFEFVANVPDTGDFSVDSHYVRQVDIYHKTDTAQSTVIVISNDQPNNYIPKDANDINYVQVIHPFVSTTGLLGNKITFTYNKEQSQVISIF